MTHRAAQVTEAMARTLAAFSLLAVPAVFTNRELSLSEESGEIPCICVNEGDDTPLSEEGFDNLANFDSVLEFEVTGYAVGPTIEDVEAELQRQRRYVHAALLEYLTAGGNPLGLDFVIAVKPAGAAKSDRSVAGKQPAGSKTSFWRVHYRARTTDPGDD
ncbi:MAG TPA: hypothetical protein VD932_03640 [Aquabacterium sp.]|nr:hypothetical protein [Aquabacterium sp.]